MSPNLYDLLNVDETADAAAIRAAWKGAIADLDPTDRRFRAYNDAAGVLLDQDKRTAYDAELASARAEEETPDEAAAGDAPVEEEPAEVPLEEPAASEVPAAMASAGPPLWAIAVAAVAAVVAVVLAGLAIAAPDVKPRAEQAAQLTTVGDQVEQLLADKVVPAMSYDYRTLGTNLSDLQQYMTPAMAAKQAKLWKALTPEAKKQHIVVDSHVPADAPGTGLKRVSEDGDRAVVLAFIDQDIRKLASAPASLHMWATFVLAKDPATGDWLVDDVCSDRVCS